MEIILKHSLEFIYLCALVCKMAAQLQALKAEMKASCHSRIMLRMWVVVVSFWVSFVVVGLMQEIFFN